MEMYSSTTRFALACNLSSKIIEPIQSRCAILRFTKLSDEQVLKRLNQVIQEEKVCQSSLSFLCSPFLLFFLSISFFTLLSEH